MSVTSWTVKVLDSDGGVTDSATLRGFAFKEWGFVHEKGATPPVDRFRKGAAVYRWWKRDPADRGYQIIEQLLQKNKKKPLSGAIRKRIEEAGGLFWSMCGATAPGTRTLCAFPHEHESAGVTSHSFEDELQGMDARASRRARQQASEDDKFDLRYRECTTQRGKSGSAFPLNIEEIFSVEKSEARMRALLDKDVVLPSNRALALETLAKIMADTTVTAQIPGKPMFTSYGFRADKAKRWPSEDELWKRQPDGTRERRKKYEGGGDGGRTVTIPLRKDVKQGGKTLQFIKDPLDILVELEMPMADYAASDTEQWRCRYFPYECRSADRKACYGALRATLYELFTKEGKLSKAPSADKVIARLNYYTTLNMKKKIRAEDLKLLEESGAIDEEARQDYREQRPVRFVKVNGKTRLVEATPETVDSVWARLRPGKVPTEPELKRPLIGSSGSGLSAAQLFANQQVDALRVAFYGPHHLQQEVKSVDGHPGTMEVFNAVYQKAERVIEHDQWKRMKPPAAMVPAGSRVVAVEDRVGGLVTVRLPGGEQLSFKNPSRRSRAGGGERATIATAGAGEKSEVERFEEEEDEIVAEQERRMNRAKRERRQRVNEKRGTKKERDQKAQEKKRLERQKREAAAKEKEEARRKKREEDEARQRQKKAEAEERERQAKKREEEEKKKAEEQQRKKEEARKKEEEEQRKKKGALLEGSPAPQDQGQGRVKEAQSCKLGVTTFAVPNTGLRVCVRPVPANTAATKFKLKALKRGDPTAIAECSGRGGRSLYEYQRFVGGHVTPESGNNLLVVHSTGSGKTCTMVAIVASFLRANLEKASKRDWLPIVVVAPPKNLKNVFREILQGCGVLQVLDRPSEMTAESVCKRLHIFGYSYVEFANRVAAGDRRTADPEFPLNPILDDLSAPGRRCLVLFDEAHNFAPEYLVTEKKGGRPAKAGGGADSGPDDGGTGGSDAGVTRTQTIDSLKAGEAWEFLQPRVARDMIQIVLLTATPIKREPHEIGKLLKLLLRKGDNRQIPFVKEDFEAKYLRAPQGLKAFVKDAKGLISYYDATADAARFPTLVQTDLRSLAQRSDVSAGLKRGIQLLLTSVSAAGNFGVVRVPVSQMHFERWKECNEKQIAKQVKELSERNSAALAESKALGEIEKALPKSGRGKVATWPSGETVTWLEKLRAIGEAKGRLSQEALDELFGFTLPLHIFKMRLSTMKANRSSIRKSAKAECRMLQNEADKDSGIRYVVNPNVVASDALTKLTTQISAANMVRAPRKDTNSVSAQMVEIPCGQQRAEFAPVMACRQQDLFEQVSDKKCKVSSLLKECYNAPPGRLEQVLNDAKDGVSRKLWALLTNAQRLEGKHFVFTASLKSTGIRAIAAALWCAGFQQLSFENANAARTARLEKEVARLKKSKDRADLRRVAELEEQLSASGRWALDPASVREDRSFIVLPTTTNQALLEAMLAVFNAPANSKGKTCKIVVASAAYNQGISLFAVHWTHLFDAPLDLTTRTQALARGVRLCGSVVGGHEDPKDWFNVVLAYVSTVPEDGRTPRDELPLLTDGEAMVRCVREELKYRNVLCAAQRAAIDYGFWSEIPGNDACGKEFEKLLG